MIIWDKNLRRYIHMEKVVKDASLHAYMQTYANLPTWNVTLCIIKVPHYPSYGTTL